MASDSRQPISGSHSSYGAMRRDGGLQDNLSEQIGKHIFKVNNNASALERQARKIGTSDDGPELRDKLHEIQAETNGIATQISEMIQNLQRNAARGDRQKRLHVERLKTSFKSALDRYSNIQQRVKNQLKGESLRVRTQSVDQEPEMWSDDSQLLAQTQRREQLLQEQRLVEDEYDLAREREERMRQLEADVLNVNDIFRELGTMLVEQGEQIDDIEANVVHAADNVSEGNVQLEKAAAYQKSYRKKLCILAIILVVVGGVIALILGLSLKK